MNTFITLETIGFLKIYDPKSGYVFLDKKNSINYENMSLALAYTLSNRGYGSIYQLAFGNGAASIDATGLIAYLPPNSTGQNATLYNQTYQKVVDDNLIVNTQPLDNKMTVTHTSGKVYTDIMVQCLLDYGEPSNQLAFDNGTNINNEYTFDEMGLLGNFGTDESGNVVTKLLTHVVFHPIQKALNIQLQIDYTIRIQSIANQLTT
jgi:hypothetical protein